MATVDRHDVWASGDAYEPYVGRWSRLVARKFLDWLSLPEGARWLDVGCGTSTAASRKIRASPRNEASSINYPIQPWAPIKDNVWPVAGPSLD